MLLRRRIVLLVMGFCGSVAAGLLLLTNCVSAASTPVVAQVSMSFPCAIDGSPLILQGITGYEGPYIEDGSDEEVADVAALILHNAGDRMIENAQIQLICAQNQLDFWLTYLPAGASIVVLERSAQPWIPQEVYDCTASYRVAEEEVKPQLRIRQIDPKTIEISSLTDTPVCNITIFHKSWSEQIGCYLGGITYETHVDSIQHGQILLLNPEHFAAGSSQIVKVGDS